MASTNKTTNYELSQFLGTDKPAWLTDYNSDMSKIDTGINAAQSTATGADGKADSNTTAIGTLSNLTTENKTSLVSAINEVDSNADTAQGTANAAAAKANTNAESITTIRNILNMNTTLTYNSSTLTSSNGTIGNGELYVSRNSDGSLFKVYGNILITSSAAGTMTINIPNTGVSSTTSYTIVGCGIGDSPNAATARAASIVVGTDGTLQVKVDAGSSGETNVVRLFACIYFNSDFGNILPQE